jgi:hypothetical protein
MAEELPLEKLRAYLRELKPEARALLLSELERGALGGAPAGNVLLEELRRDLRSAAQPSKPPPPPQGMDERDRANAPARMFFKPLEPFLVDDTPDHAHRGRVPRASLEPIWQWICRDLMASAAAVYSDQITRLLLTNDRAMSERLARAFQDQVAERVREALAAAQDDVKARQKLGAQIGTPRAVDDLREVLGILRARDALGVFASRLPAQIKNLADDHLDNVKALLDSPVGGHRDVFVYALILVMSRLASPWQLVRLAIKAAESDVATKVAGTTYAIAVSIVLGEMERVVGKLRDNVKRGRFTAIGDLLKEIHDAARTLRTEMDLSGDSPWARQLTTIRSSVSNMLKSEIETVSGRMRRLVRPRKASEIARSASLDASEVDETEALIEFVGICRNYASELAINEVTLRVHSELQNYLETQTPALLDGLRTTDEAHRPFRLSQVDAAVRFAGKVFGASYAALLAKAAEVAAQGGDRKAAKPDSGERKAAAKA